MKRFAVTLSAAALVGASLPMSAEAKPAFSGYATEVTASPVWLEIYEPTIPIPSEPQAEFKLSYSKVETASGSGNSVASFLWPGDPVGQGGKTFMEQLGLKDFARDYPVQVNANHPSGPAKQSDAPFPGTVQQASADEKATDSRVGWSSDGDVAPAEPAEGGGGQPEPAPVPTLPGLPAPLPPGADAGSRTTTASGSAAEEEPEGAPGLPPELAALVDVGGMSSLSRSETSGSKISSLARSSVSDIALLGGVVTIEGVTSRTTSSSTGNASAAEAVTRVGGITIAGQEFGFGAEGFVVPEGAPKPAIPGLPDDPDKALAALGLAIELPTAREKAGKMAAETDVQGLVVTIDTRVLRSQLDGIPFDDIVNQLPDEMGQLKSLIGAAVQLSPKFVLHFGAASTSTETVKGIKLPPLPSVDTGAAATPSASSGGTTTSGATSTGTGALSTDAGVASAGVGGETIGTLPDAALTKGLPPLNTIPGMLTLSGIGIACALGAWLRRLGMLVLGGAGTCSHGLDTGLPDLRRM